MGRGIPKRCKTQLLALREAAAGLHTRTMTESLRAPCAALTAGVAPSAAEAGGPSASGGACAQQRGECQQQHHQLEQQKHAAAMHACFARSQAAAHSQLDLYSGICLSALLLLALPRSMQREHWRTQLAGFAAEVGLRLVPAYLACIAYDVYLPRRTYIVAACRLAGTLLPTLAVLPPALAVQAAWGGWMHFLLFTRSLGVNTLPLLARLPFKASGFCGNGPPCLACAVAGKGMPCVSLCHALAGCSRLSPCLTCTTSLPATCSLQWFAWVQLVGVAAAARLSLSTACASLAFTSPAAQQQFAAVARVAQYLTTFAPIHTPTLQGEALRPGGCAAQHYNPVHTN